MEKVKRILFCTIIMLACSLTVTAQQIDVSGTVKTAGGEGIIGATVRDESAGGKGTVTDIDGNFSLKAGSGATLSISYIGMKTVTVKAAPRLDITMEEDSRVMDEVVVTGYMTEKKASLTGSVAVVKMKEVADQPTGNVMQALQGRVPGMNITSDGVPGGGNTSVLVRGVTTINNSSPLYVIDGVQTRDNIASIISANDVESIQVLKDASSAAIYGAQAANGVIIITTKRAKEGDVRVSFDATLTAQTFVKPFDMLDTEQWGRVYWQAYRNDYGTHPNSVVYGNGESPVVQQYYYDKDGRKIRVGNTDWMDELYGTALMQNYSLTLSKGFKDGNMAFTLNYIDQDGVCRNSDFKRFNSRMTSDFKFLDGKVRVGESVAFNYWTNHNNPGGVEENVIAQHPAIPVYDEQGGYAGGYVDVLGDKPNMVRLSDNEKNNRHRNWRVFGNVYAEIEPLKNLTFRSNFGLNYLHVFNSSFTPSWTEASRTVDTNEISVDENYSMQWVWSNVFNYHISLGHHSIQAMAGMEAKHEYGENLSGYGRGLVIESIDYRYLDTATGGKNCGNMASEYALVSYFGKVNYDYDGRYLLSATVRRDASSRFGQNKNSGVFPSVSAGWRISGEKFMENTRGWLSDLKLRAAWGINGNDMIDNTATYDKFFMNLGSGGYNFSGDNVTLRPGAVKDHSANHNLKWEETTQTNFGVDAAFLDNRLGVSLDYFHKRTTDMLIERPYIGVIGEGGYSWYNGISMNNDGFEAMVTWRDRVKDFSYNVSFNMSYYRNKITDLPEDIYYTYGGGNGLDQSIVGQPLGSWMGYRTDGLFRTQKEVDDYLARYQVEIGKPGVGRIRYADINGDNKINTADQTWLGSDQPKIVAGLNLGAAWKGFDVSLFFNGMVRDAWNNAKFYTDLFQGWTGNHSTRLLDACNAWEQYGKTGYYGGDVPALTTVDNNSETRSSDYFIEDGSFIKLKSATVGYTLPESLTAKAGLAKVRFYLLGQNLFTITGYKGADPENLGYAYPLARSFTLGAQIAF